jgi:hypothetical protein
MMSTSTFPPIAVQLDAFGVDDKNNIWVRVRFDDGSEWVLEWASESSDAREALDFFADLVSRTIARFGQRGVAITAFTPVEEEHDP